MTHGGYYGTLLRQVKRRGGVRGVVARRAVRMSLRQALGIGLLCAPLLAPPAATFLIGVRYWWAFATFFSIFRETSEGTLKRIVQRHPPPSPLRPFALRARLLAR
jgi:hypothetical protein